MFEVTQQARAEKARLGAGVEPGPASFATPGQHGPQEFTRPPVTEGHAALSPQHDAPCSAAVTDGTPEPSDFRGAYLAIGHAGASPSGPAMPEHVDLRGSRAMFRTH